MGSAGYRVGLIEDRAAAITTIRIVWWTFRTTYRGNVVSGVSVGLDTFAGIDSTLTINRDGSGNASFRNLIGTTSSVDEAGTVTWTCSA